MHTGTGDIRKRLAAWVAEKISGQRYAPIADAPIAALQEQLFARRALTRVECWCEACDSAANKGLRTRMSVCPECGDKRCPRAQQHGNECQMPPKEQWKAPVEPSTATYGAASPGEPAQ